MNRWIRGETFKTWAVVTKSIEDCAFDDVAGALYRFIWNVYCDWFLEFAKPILGGVDEEAKAETRAMAAWVLETILKLLHPVMPFVTEELWSKTAARDGMLITAPWPDLPQNYLDASADSEMNWLVTLITEVRQLRAEMSVPPSARPPLALIGADTVTRQRLQRHDDLILALGRLASVAAEDAAPAGSAPFVIGEATGALAIAEFIDLAAERARIDKEIAGHVSDIDRTAKKLANADFVSRAPEDVVEENRERLAEARNAKSRLEAAKTRLDALV